MDIIEAIYNRRSIRKFKPDPVPREVLEQLVDASRWSPSRSNTQPWEFAILGGKVLDEIKDLIEKHVQSTPTHPDIPRHPDPEPYSSRHKAILQIVEAHHWQSFFPNRFFGAPNAIIVCTDREICPIAFLDLGMVAQTIALAALNYGLGTCIMMGVTSRPEIYRELLGIPDSKLIAFGIAIGYPDMRAQINNFACPRELPDTFVHWYGV